MDWRLLDYAKEAEDTASGLHVLLGEIPQYRKDITSHIAELFAISNALHVLQESLGLSQYARFIGRIMKDLEVCLPSLEYTLDDLRSTFTKKASRADTGAFPGPPSYAVIWEFLLEDQKAQGIPLAVRLELFRTYLHHMQDALKGDEDDEELRSIRIRLQKLLKKQEPIDSYFNRLSVHGKSYIEPPKSSSSKTSRPDVRTQNSFYTPPYDYDPPSVPQPPIPPNWEHYRNAPFKPPPVPEIPRSPPYSSATSSYSHDSAYGSGASNSIASAGHVVHWAMKIFDGRHSTTPFEKLGDLSVCHGRDMKRAIELLEGDGFERVMEIPFEATNVWVRLYHRSDDHRARILFLTKNSSGDRMRYCIPLTALKVSRTDSSLELCRVSRLDGQQDLWARLRFTVYERMVLFYCTVVAMKSQDQNKESERLEDGIQLGEAVEFSAEITDSTYIQAFRVLRDIDSSCVRFQVTPRRGPLKTTPIWTAFVTQYIGQRSWAKRIGYNTVQFREFHPYVFFEGYMLPKGASGRHQITFVQPEDARDFLDMLHHIKIRSSTSLIFEPQVTSVLPNRRQHLGSPKADPPELYIRAYHPMKVVLLMLGEIYKGQRYTETTSRETRLLRGCEQVILIDDSKSVLPYWDEISHTAEALVNHFEMMKLSMTQLQFTSLSKTRYRHLNGSMLQDILDGIEPSGERNMRSAFNIALRDCYPALENKLLSSEPQIGTIIYVLTDGRSLCDPRQFRAVKGTIKATIQKLERPGSLKYVGIQFIQFGDSGEASIALTELNVWLCHNEDILNTEQFSANVFQMHSGALGKAANDLTAKTDSKSTASDQTPNLNTIGHLGKTYNDGMAKDQKSVQNDAPEIIKDDLEYRDVFGSGPVWTCTPSQDIQLEDIPLTISGHPVVVPVEYHYPASAFTVPPPDPHPHFIDSSSEIDEDTMNDIFRTFEGVLGFYLLINGMLQLIVPDDFDFEYGLSHQPNEFGGLRVSYIFQAIEPTAEREQGLSSTSLEQHSITEQSNVRQRVTESSSPKQIQSQLQSTPPSSPNASINRTPGQANLMDLMIGSMVQARVKRSKVTERFQGKIGVMTEAEGQYYLVVPSHILTKALTAAKSDRFPGENWKDHVMVIGCNGGREVGQIAETFDPYARIFPHGFQCDVSLVDVTPTAMSLVPSMRSPIPADWLSQAGWSSIKYNSQNLFLLDKPDLQAKSIGILVSQCQMVGQAILKLSEKSGKKTRFRFPFQQKKSDTVTDVETWTGAVSRSVLYRVDSTSLAPGALSGVAVCVRESSDDDTSCAKIAGFSSWAQPVSDYTRFDMEGPKFYNRLQEGRVAFYGAFQAPPQLRDGHRIV